MLATGTGLLLVSGLPGHGKTLYTVSEVEQLRRETKRQVYQHGIKGLTLPWLTLEDPKKWQEVPDGSIVVIDEAWQFFPKRPPGGAVPPYIQALATHRHRGIDLVLVTQHPGNQLDHFVRGLVGAHYHVRRIFGSARSRLYTWRALGDPNDYHSKKEAVASFFTFPREVFDWYKSAEVHTVKRQIPLKPFAIMGGGALAVGLLGWFTWWSLSSSTERIDRTTGEAAAAFEGQPAAARVSAVMQAESFVPAVPLVPFSAPFYASNVKVNDVPVIAGCGVLQVGTRRTCKCTDQQGNTVRLEQRECLAVFEAGIFSPTEGKRYPVIEPYVPSLPGPSNPGDDAPGIGPQGQAGAATGEGSV